MHRQYGASKGVAQRASAMHTLLCLCMNLLSALHAGQNAKDVPTQSCSQRACTLTARELAR
jgi:hypothetical protein